jgi:YfiH family protein
MHRLTHHNLVYYQFDALRALGVNHGIFTRLGGVSQGQWASLNMSCTTGDAPEPVRENCRRALQALGLRPEQTCSSWMVHGRQVRVVQREDLNAPGANDARADALVTQARGVALTLRFADCLPVMLYDPQQGAAGLAHAGWRGIVAGVLAETVRAMQSAFGSRPRDIIAGIGPSIGPHKFEVGADVAAQIQGAVPEPVVRQAPDRNKAFVDLWAAARAQLAGAGVGHIEIAGICTASDTQEWFSHRAERGRTGRFGAIVALE